MKNGFKIRPIPSNANPTPRPPTSNGRPGTASRPGTSGGRPASSCGLQDFQPTTFDEPIKSVFEDMLTEEYILKLTGAQTVDGITSISLTVDTSYQSLLNLGDIMPNLRHLALDNSNLYTIRDLGTSVRNLLSISLNSCRLTDLDGIGMFAALKELSLQNNQISDITALAMHESIEAIDLHGNRINDISIGDTLSSCLQLKSLVLTSNPIAHAPRYRLVLAAMVPQLLTLDGSPVDSTAKSKVSNGMILEAASAMQLEQEELDDERRMEMAILGDDFRTAAAVGCYMGEHKQADLGVDPDTGSELTHGSSVVLAGNMASAMRRRRQPTAPSPMRGKSKQTMESESDTSVLATLDSALVGNGFQLEKQDLASIYYGEGDITAMVMQEGGLAGNKKKNPRSPRPGSSSTRSIPASPMKPASRPIPASSPSMKDMKRKGSGGRLGSPSRFGGASASFDQEMGCSLDQDDDTGGMIGLASSENIPLGWVGTRPASRQLNANTPLRGRSPSPLRGIPPRSPPVRPSTRPDSASSTGSVGIAVVPSAPFKVPISQERSEAQETGDLANRMTPSADKTQSSSHAAWDVSDDSSDEGLYGLRRVPKKTSGKSGAAPSATRYSSLVHRNSVLRGVLFDDDDVAIDHESRRKMSTENIVAQKTTSNSTMKLFSSSLPSSKTEGLNQPRSRPTGNRESVPSPEASGQNRNTLSNMAGRSLGFDLKGSLAAINQWVQEMDSDDEDDSAVAAKNGSMLQSLCPASDADSATSGSYSSTNGASKKILSRDTIMNMCTRGDESSAATSISGGGGNEDEDLALMSEEAAAMSEPCEENNIAFFDNNVEKKISKPSRSSNTGRHSSRNISRDSPVDTPVEYSSTLDPVTQPSVVSEDRLGVTATGPGVEMSDDALVVMLSQPPKSYPQMRTKTSFQDFFRGMQEGRMKELLRRAYGNLNELERESKVRKRMDLLAGVLMNPEDDELYGRSSR